MIAGDEWMLVFCGQDNYIVISPSVLIGERKTFIGPLLAWLLFGSSFTSQPAQVDVIVQ